MLPEFRIRNFFIVIFTLKLIFTTSITYYYSELTLGDQRNYLKDLNTLTSILRESPEKALDLYLNKDFDGKEKLTYGANKRSLNLEKIILPIYLLTAGSIWLTVFIIALLQTLIMTAIWYHSKVPDYIKLILLTVFVVPGVAFWTSGVIKESVFLIFFLFFIYGLFILRKTSGTIIVIISGVICFSIKPYNSILLFGIILISQIILNKKINKAVLISILLFVIICLIILPWLDPNFGPDRWGEVIKENQNFYYASSCNQENCIPFDRHQSPINPENIIIALFYGLFGPINLSANNNLILLSSIQKIILLGVTIFCWFSVIREKTNKLLTCSLIIYIVLSSVLTALTTVNFGTLMRYSVFYTPVIWGGFFYFSVKYFRQLQAKRSDFNSFAKKEIK